MTLQRQAAQHRMPQAAVMSGQQALGCNACAAPARSMHQACATAARGSSSPQHPVARVPACQAAAEKAVRQAQAARDAAQQRVSQALRSADIRSQRGAKRGQLAVRPWVGAVQRAGRQARRLRASRVHERCSLAAGLGTGMRMLVRADDAGAQQPAQQAREHT